MGKGDDGPNKKREYLFHGLHNVIRRLKITHIYISVSEWQHTREVGLTLSLHYAKLSAILFENPPVFFIAGHHLFAGGLSCPSLVRNKW